MTRYPLEQNAPQGQAATQVHHELVPAAPHASGEARVRQAPADPGKAAEAEQFLAAACYLGVIFFSFLPALIIYLSRGRTPGYLHDHAARAANLAITLLLYNLSALIVGGMLALDTVVVALIIVTPLAAAVWIVALGCLLRAAIAAERRQSYELPEWLCVPVLKQGR